MTRTLVIDPVTRLEGHGRIDIRLDAKGQVAQTYFQVPDFKGFEKFCEGRALEEMPTLTQKICGVCPTAHHIASCKTLDRLFDAPPPRAGVIIRELMNTAFIFEDHLLHFFYLGGPDLIVGPTDGESKRNIFGVIETMGREIGRQIIAVRKKVRDLNSLLCGSPLYPANGLPGGVSRPVPENDTETIRRIAAEALEFGRTTLKWFENRILKDKRFLELLHHEAFSMPGAYLGLVDENGQLSFYDGRVRIVAADGRQFASFDARDYADYLVEEIDTWSYMKRLRLKDTRRTDAIEAGKDGVYRVGPLARLNVSDGLSTPLAQEAVERFFRQMGGKPVHHTLAFHWARLIEVLHAAERMVELAADSSLTDPNVRTLPAAPPVKGRQAVGVCEAPRGTLLHHYEAEDGALVHKLNLIVATQHNAAALALSIDRAARAFIGDGELTDRILNLIEMAYRAYDPCLACATH